MNKAPKRRNQTEEPTSRYKKAQVPRRNDRLELNSKNEKNHIKDNMEKVIYDNSTAVKIRAQQEEKKKKEDNMQIHKHYGKIPGYINKFN